ncbi:hypothetical protein V7S43_013879 [Phytophthora oleae]|uniref:Uncharacterized protein n=1 Tax=Phytophthora oleae TaxID=2107226 RepID=A0ABD3F6F4_9STRA
MGKKSTAQAAVVEAIALRLFPPQMKYPEMGPSGLLYEWFEWPTIKWVPKCLEANRKPKCVVEGCRCVPKVKKYKIRTVEDISHRTVLYYARYQCTGPTTKSLSTISDAYLSSSKPFVPKFLYLLTYKTGISSDMFDIVYDSILSTK